MKRLWVFAVCSFLLNFIWAVPFQVQGAQESTSAKFKNYLKLRKNKIENIFAQKVSNDNSLSIMESHMSFPCVFIKDLGLTFVFINDTDNIEPRLIVIADETNINGLNIVGAKPGMCFKDIMGLLGRIKVQKTWLGYEDDTAYMIEYKLEGLRYSFVSGNPNGSDSEFYVELAE